jgi:hypothetical protein
LARYLRTGYELSSEHSTILSLPGSLTNLYLALTLLACYAVVVALLLWARNRALPLAIAMAGPLFLEFKHSFIREPGHLEILFLFLPLVAAVLVLFVKESGRTRGALIAAAVLFGSLSLYAQRPRRINLAGAKALREIFAWTELKGRLAGQNAANLAVDILPPELMARVGKSSISFFPWESSYAAANE